MFFSNNIIFYRDALHSKMFRNQIEFFAKEEIPTYSQLVNIIENDVKPRLSRRQVYIFITYVYLSLPWYVLFVCIWSNLTFFLNRTFCMYSYVKFHIFSVTSGICDAIVNKAVFHVYGLNPKRETCILDAE